MLHSCYVVYEAGTLSAVAHATTLPVGVDVVDILVLSAPAPYRRGVRLMTPIVRNIMS